MAKSFTRQDLRRSVVGRSKSNFIYFSCPGSGRDVNGQQKTSGWRKTHNLDTSPMKKKHPQKSTAVSETRTYWFLQHLNGEPLMLGTKYEADFFVWHYEQICKGEWLTWICEIHSLGENMEKICPWQDMPLKALCVTQKKLKSLLSVQTTAWSLWEKQSDYHSWRHVEENKTNLGIPKNLLKN